MADEDIHVPGWSVQDVDSQPPQPPQPPQSLPPPSWADLASLFQTVQSIGEAIQASHTTQAQFGHAIQAITNQVTGLTNHMTAPPAPPPTQLPSTKGPPKFREPRVFKGKASEVDQFLIDIDDAVHLHKDALVNDYDKCVYMATFLDEGSPKQWYSSIRKDPTLATILQNFDTFRQTFRKHFGNPDAVAEQALAKIRVLRQSGSAASYTSRFLELLVHLDWTDRTKIDNYRAGLKPSVKDAIALVDRKDIPTLFVRYVDWVIGIDNRLHQRAEERKLENNGGGLGKSHNSNGSAGRSIIVHDSPAAAPASSLPSGVPMEIDATKTSKPRGPLTAEEKDRRHKNNLCLYCGGANHKASSCPNMSNVAKKRFADKASPQAGKV